MRQLLVLFAVALSLRLGLFLVISPWQPDRIETRTPDAWGYLKITSNLYLHGVFSADAGSEKRPETRRVPLFPAFAAAIYKVAGPKPHLVVLALVLIGAASCLTTYGIARELFSARVGLAAGYIHAFEPAGVLYANQFLTDPLFVALFGLHAYFVVRCLKSVERPRAERLRLAGIAGVLLGLTALTRPTSVYFAAFLAPLFWIAGGAGNAPGGRRRALASWGVLSLAFLAMTIPWMIRNHHAFGKFLLSRQQEQVVKWFFPSHLPARPAPAAGTKPAVVATPAASNSQATDSGTEAAASEADALQRPDILYVLKRYAYSSFRFFWMVRSGYPRALGLKPAPTAKPSESSTDFDSVGGLRSGQTATERFWFIFPALVLVFLYTTALYGFVRLSQQREWAHLAFFMVFIGYFVLATGSVARNERYRLPVLPYVITLSAYGLVTWRERSRNVRQVHLNPEHISSGRG